MLEETTREWCLMRLYQEVEFNETTRESCLMRLYQGVVLDETLPGSGA